MDGFALGEEIPGNAVLAAATPQLDYLFSQYPFCQLEASGLDVGLPDGQMGNSEVGHTNIGAGRVVFQDLPKISHAIEDGTFFENSAYLEAIQACKETGSALHLMGLLSDGRGPQPHHPSVCPAGAGQTSRFGTALYSRLFGWTGCLPHLGAGLCPPTPGENTGPGHWTDRRCDGTVLRHGPGQPLEPAPAGL